MSDTPETDHLEVQLGKAATHSHPILWEHSRKMERERDAAIEHWEEVREYGTDEINASVDLRQKLAQALVELDNMQDQRDLAMKVISRLERERDEAREAFVIATDQMVVAQCKLREANRERDEAREELRDIRLNLGVDAEGYTSLLHAVCALQNERDEAKAQLRKILKNE